MTTRQDLGARAVRLSLALLALHRRASTKGSAYAHIALQVFRSGTAIGANIEEGQAAHGRRDMASKYTIALRDARETEYWLRLLAQDADLKEDASALRKEAGEFVAMLSVSVTKLRSRP